MLDEVSSLEFRVLIPITNPKLETRNSKVLYPVTPSQRFSFYTSTKE